LAIRAVKVRIVVVRELSPNDTQSKYEASILPLSLRESRRLSGGEGLLAEKANVF